MFRNKNNWLLLMLAMAGIISLNACSHDRNSPGFDYFPDMKYSEALNPNGSSNITGNGASMMMPVKGTIPRGIVPYPYPKTDEGMTKAGENLHNPLDSTEANIERGKTEYEIYCGLCHGNDGEGDGILVTNEKYPSTPPALTGEDILERPDGEIYHVITLGSAIMGAHASQIRPQDRWAIILYIKNVLAQSNESDKPE